MLKLLFARAKKPCGPSPRARLGLEQLETRLALSLTPTAAEQLFLERLNDARADPAAYGSSIGLDLSGVSASMPLAFDPRIIEAARLHSQDMSDQNYFSHTGSDGSSPGGRMSAAGYPWRGWGESIAAGYSTPEAALRALIIDSGVPDLGHRRHLLAIDSSFQSHRDIGIGVVQNGSGSYHNYYTLDSGYTSNTGAYLTGVVYDDRNGSGKYDAGEGLGGVTVNVAGVGSVTTWSSGGYSLRVGAGTYTVTASGGDLPSSVNRQVTVGSWNYRLNFNPEAAPTGPEVQVSLGATDVLDGSGTVNFGTAFAGGAVTNTFTVKNVGVQTLTLGSAISVPSGFSLAAGFGSTSLAPGASTTFQVRLDAATAGNYSGQVSFATNDANENPFNFTVSGAVVNSLILDNGQTGYSESGAGWFNTAGGVYNGGGRANAAGSGSAAASWQLTALPAGSYQVQATWAGYSDQASNARFEIYDGTTLLASATVNQKQDPTGTTVGGAIFQTLGTLTVNSGTLRVVLSDLADGYVIADAVRVVAASGTPAPTSDLNWAGGSLVGPSSATASTPFTVSRTYNVSGAAVADNFTIAYYASANSTFGDADDVLLGTETVTAAADKTVGTHSGTSPALQVATPGTYYLFAKLDGANAVAETSESNNVQQAAQQVTVTGAPAAVVLDNGGTGYSESGSGWFNTTGGVYGGGGRANAAGDGSATATWQAGLTAGTYQVQATWEGYSDQASNATFKIYQGTTLLATAAVNQKQDPTGATVGGAVFQTLAMVNMTSGGGELRVVLSDAADGYVIADAVRIVPAAAPTSDLNWSGGSLSGPSSVSASAPFTVSRTYNVGGAAVADNFTISYYASANATFGDADDVLLGSETVTAAADKTAGTHSGTSPALQIATPGTYYLFAKLDGGGAVAETNEANNVLQATQTVAVTGAIVLDNSSLGYSEAGSGWFNTAGGIFGGAGRANAAGSGSATATWQQGGLTAGTYQVQATWEGYSDHASNATFKVYQGTTLLATVAVNQKQDPTGTTVGGAVFQTLASVNLTSGGGELRVVLSDAADGYVIADAVRIVPV